MTKQKPIKIECIKPITLEGEDDGLPDTLECNTGDVFGDRYTTVHKSDNTYWISHGAGSALYIYADDFEEHFRLIQP